MYSYIIEDVLKQNDTIKIYIFKFSRINIKTEEHANKLYYHSKQRLPKLSKKLIIYNILFALLNITSNTQHWDLYAFYLYMQQLQSLLNNTLTLNTEIYMHSICTCNSSSHFGLH